jgi:hypothetical protein
MSHALHIRCSVQLEMGMQDVLYLFPQNLNEVLFLSVMTSVYTENVY